MPDYIDWFVNRDKQYQGFLKMLARETPKTLMLVEASSEMGKTWLIQRIRHYCGENDIPAMHVDFRDRRAYDYLSLVRTARDQIGEQHFNHLTATINNFTGVNITLSNANTGSSGGVNVSGGAVNAQDIAGRDVIKDNQFYIQADSDMQRRAAEIKINDAFFFCLTELLKTKKAVAFLFDSFEDVTTEAENWLNDYLLSKMRESQLEKAIVVIAGRKVPQLGETAKAIVAKTGLDLFTEEHVKEYIVNRRKIEGLDLETVFKTSRGFPGLLAKMADAAGMGNKSDEEWL